MRIAVFSDTHGLTSPMVDAVSRSRPDAVFHLGDHDRDTEVLLRQFPEIPLYNVAGNCDFSGSERECLAPLFGKRFFLTHGHAYRVKSTMQLLKARAYEAEADCVLFGHTHEPYNEYDSGRLYLNPGAACDGRFSILRVESSGDLFAEMY